MRAHACLSRTHSCKVLVFVVRWAGRWEGSAQSWSELQPTTCPSSRSLCVALRITTHHIPMLPPFSNAGVHTGGAPQILTGSLPRPSAAIVFDELIQIAGECNTPPPTCLLDSRSPQVCSTDLTRTHALVCAPRSPHTQTLNLAARTARAGGGRPARFLLIS
jgi:hypothetical protein